MSFFRVALISIQAISNQLAYTPPNPTHPNNRYHTEEPYALQIAPLIFKIHQIILWWCAVFEVTYYFTAISPFSSPLPISTNSLICPLSQPSAIRATPLFVIGVLAVMLGAYIRIDCFRALGELFTFDLTVHPKHRLITSRFYGYVRHPAYTGSILVVAGLALSHFTQGSWLTTCGPLRIPGTAVTVWALWWAWTLCVGFSRAEAEDKQMQKLFKAEWEAYATQVPWWFLPGLL